MSKTGLVTQAYTEQLIIQSIYRSIHHSFNQSINHSVNKPINQSVNPSISQPTNKPINQPINQSNRPTNQQPDQPNIAHLIAFDERGKHLGLSGRDRHVRVHRRVFEHSEAFCSGVHLGDRFCAILNQKKGLHAGTNGTRRRRRRFTQLFRVQTLL